ncbi:MULTISPECIES: MarR family winged helix-turn-helix transcriptional regulator [Lysobacteraceae]|nr:MULTISPECIES: MarR family winged helix-turn-helix transcriptional regulator [Lysobacter]
MAINQDIPYPAFDDLFLFCNRLSGQLDGALKKSTPRLTITGLQVLAEMAKRADSRNECNQAQVARAIGVTPSSLVTTIRGLESNDLVGVERSEFLKTHALTLTRAGHQALRRGLVIRHDVLEAAYATLPTKYRRQFFVAARLGNAANDKARSDERQERYLKSLKKHSTRAIVRKVRAKL